MATCRCATSSSLDAVHSVDLALGEPHRVLEAQPRNGALSRARGGRSASLGVELEQRVVNSGQGVEGEDGCVGTAESLDTLEEVVADGVVVATRLKVLLQGRRVFEPG